MTPGVSRARIAAPVRGELVRSVKESGLIELNRLPATRLEAAILRKLAGDVDLLEAVGFEANRDTVLGGGLGDYRILHFATHGLVNSLFLGRLHAARRLELTRPRDLRGWTTTGAIVEPLHSLGPR